MLKRKPRFVRLFIFIYHSSLVILLQPKCHCQVLVERNLFVQYYLGSLCPMSELELVVNAVEPLPVKSGKSRVKYPRNHPLHRQFSQI